MIGFRMCGRHFSWEWYTSVVYAHAHIHPTHTHTHTHTFARLAHSKRARTVMFMRATWSIHVWHDSFLCVTWLPYAHTCPWATAVHVWHDSFLRATWFIPMCYIWPIPMCDIIYSYMWHMTHSSTWHDAFITNLPVNWSGTRPTDVWHDFFSFFLWGRKPDLVT